MGPATAANRYASPAYRRGSDSIDVGHQGRSGSRPGVPAFVRFCALADVNSGPNKDFRRCPAPE